MKAVAAVDALVYVGMIAISALMIAQLPDMINDVRTVLENQAASEETKAVSDLRILSSAAPGEITITHTPPEGNPITISKLSTPPPVISDPEKSLATTCEGDKLLKECGGIVGKGYCQWNWVEHNCFFVPGPTTPEHCRNEIKDIDETGKDCGGLRCNACQVG